MELTKCETDFLKYLIKTSKYFLLDASNIFETDKTNPIKEGIWEIIFKLHDLDEKL